jgi:invasion protein IalB
MRARIAANCAAIGIAIVTAWSGTVAPARAQGASPQELRIASLVDDGKAIAPGDLLRTTRMFPNWNLNCEVLLSQGRHLCAVELRSVDSQGRQVFSWSIALSVNGSPLMVLKVPANISQSYGLHMVIGPYTTVLKTRREDCSPIECRIVAPFESALRTLMVSQEKISFSLEREGAALQIDAPLAGLSDALDMARRDPIGLVAARGGLPAPSPRKADTRFKQGKAVVDPARLKEFDDLPLKTSLRN